MGLLDWLTEVYQEFQAESPSYATKHALHKLYLGALRRANQFTQNGETVWNEEWDILVILDACRVDIFQDACQNGGFRWLPPAEAVKSKRSVGSTSDEWMANTFDQSNHEEMRSTAYITSNPFAFNYETDQFQLFRYIGPEDINDQLRAVSPIRVTDLAVDAWKSRQKYDFDRMIVHYMQPHGPFRTKPEWFKKPRKVSWGTGFLELRDGVYDKKEFKKAYIDNLIWVLEHVENLVKSCEGTIAISADHGNGLGEWGVYGHPPKMPISAVRQVPWITLEGHGTKQYSPRYTLAQESGRNDSIEEDLSYLGYV